MSKLVIHRPRLARIQADITNKKKIYETVLKYSVVIVGGGLGNSSMYQEAPPQKKQKTKHRPPYPTHLTL